MQSVADEYIMKLKGAIKAFFEGPFTPAAPSAVSDVIPHLPPPLFFGAPPAFPTFSGTRGVVEGAW